MNKQGFIAIGIVLSAVGVFMFFRWKNSKTPAVDISNSQGTSAPPKNIVQLPGTFAKPNLDLNPFGVKPPGTLSNATNLTPAPSGTSTWGSVILKGVIHA